MGSREYLRGEQVRTEASEKKRKKKKKKKKGGPALGPSGSTRSEPPHLARRAASQASVRLQLAGRAWGPRDSPPQPRNYTSHATSSLRRPMRIWRPATALRHLHPTCGHQAVRYAEYTADCTELMQYSTTSFFPYKKIECCIQSFFFLK
jgi:hypothetical protein